jgi:dephospho-CoA kinase
MLIGIGGTDGAGKDSLGQILEEHNWLFISVTDILRAEAKRRNLPLTRQNLRQISSEWRQQFGLGVLINKAMDVYNQQLQASRGLVIASLRNPGEADRIHELGGQVVWIDAEPKLRYERIMNRRRGTEDEVTFKAFQAEEKAQMEHSGDETTLSLSGVKERADIFIENSSSKIENLRKDAEKALKLML